MLAVGALDVVARQLDAFQRVGQGQHKVGLAHAHQQPVDDGQGQRQAQRNAGSRARLARRLRSVPRRLSTRWRTTSMPTPRPETSVTCFGRRKTGLEDQREDLGLGELRHRRRPGPSRWRARAPPRHRCRVPSSADRDQHAGPGVPRGKMDGRGRGRLPRATRTSAALDAVVHAVADQVHQRIAQLVDHGLVQLGIGAFDGELDILAQIARQVVHQPAELLEGAANRQHADVHRALAQRRRQPLDLFRDRGHFGIVAARRRSRSAAPAPSPARPPGRQTGPAWRRAREGWTRCPACRRCGGRPERARGSVKSRCRFARASPADAA